MKSLSASSKIEVTELANYIEDASILDKKIRGWELDEHFASNGGRTIYAIDTDVIHLYVDRRKNGEDIGYTKIFRDDKKEFPWAICEYIAEPIFFSDAHDAEGRPVPRNLLVLPGIEEEFVDAFARFVHGAIDSTRSAISQVDLKNLLTKVNNLTSPTEKRKLIEKNFPKLFDLFFGVDSMAKRGQRLKKLGDHASITSTRMLSRSLRNRFPLDFIDVVSNLPPDFHLELADCHAKIELVFPPREKDINRKRDVESLSWLVCLNRALHHRKIRIALLTGSPTLFKVEEKLYPPKQSNQLGTSNDFVETSEFHLRHPMIFWKSLPFAQVREDIATVDRISTSLEEWTNWVNTLLPRGLHANDRKTIEIVAQRTLEAGSQNFASFRQDWETFSYSLIAKQAEILGRFDEDAEALLKQLLSNYPAFLDQLLDSTGTLGLAVAAASSGMKSRLLAPVVFDSNEKATEAINEIYASLQSLGTEVGLHSTARQVDNQISFNKLREAGGKNYFFNIGLAILFASQRQYLAASTYCDRAIHLISELSLEEAVSMNISGREAYFLASTLRRINAKHVSDYEQARRLMSEARSMCSLDMERNKGLVLSTERFDCEDIATEINEYLFRKYHLGEGGLAELDSGLLVRSQKILKGQFGGADANVRDIVFARSRINILSILQERYLWREGVVHSSDLKVLSDTVDAAKIAPNGEQASYLHKAILSVSEILLRVKRGENVTQTLLTEFASVATEEQIKQHSVSMHDSERFRQMFDQARELIGIS